MDEEVQLIKSVYFSYGYMFFDLCGDCLELDKFRAREHNAF